MKKPTLPQKSLSIISLMGIAAIIGGTIITQQSISHTNSSSNNSNTTTTNKASAEPVPTTTSTTTLSSTQACTILTLTVAQQALGQTAKPGSADATLLPQTNDTSPSFCAYAANTSRVQLSIRAPKNQLGISENAIAFGSNKPQNATSIPGYGQSAYWTPDEHQLNILNHNNWYAITLNTNGKPADITTTESTTNLFITHL